VWLIKGILLDVLTDAIDVMDWAEEELSMALDTGRGWLVSLIHIVDGR
jgi:hypothetical protein